MTEHVSSPFQFTKHATYAIVQIAFNEKIIADFEDYQRIIP